MIKTTLRTTLLLAAGCLLASSAMARVYTVTLSNGHTVESRYRPMIAPWDEGKVMLMTMVGNWISLSKAEIADVEVDIEVAGYGRVIDNTTVDLGFSANDRPTGEAAPPSAQEQLLQFMQAQQDNRPVYNTEQFAEPNQASGIPVWMTNTTTPPVGIVTTPQPEPANP
jgi:hypothetical protein